MRGRELARVGRLTRTTPPFSLIVIVNTLFSIGFAIRMADMPGSRLNETGTLSIPRYTVAAMLLSNDARHLRYDQGRYCAVLLVIQ